MAGTPGACSQVFCHPIRCMFMRSYRQRHVRYSIVRTTTTTTHHPSRFPQRLLFLRSFRKQLCAVSHGCRQRCRRRHRQCPPPEGATTQTVPSARTSERRHGPVREYAPHLEGSEEGQGRGGGTRSTARPRSGSASPPGFPATLSR